MSMVEAHSIAKKLTRMYGLKAEVEAAQKLQDAREARDDGQIELWTRVRSAVREMKPAHQS